MNSTYTEKTFLTTKLSDKVKANARDYKACESLPLRSNLAFQYSGWEIKLTSPHMPSHNQVIWELLSRFKKHDAQCQEECPMGQDISLLHSLCLKSNFSSGGQVISTREKYSIKKDGWNERKSDNSIPSRIHSAKGRKQNSSPISSFQWGGEWFDRLSRVTGDQHQGDLTTEYDSISVLPG